MTKDPDKISLPTSNMMYLTPVRILTITSMLKVTLIRMSSSLKKDPIPTIDLSQSALTRATNLK
jgi:hypothetical protein